MTSSFTLYSPEIDPNKDLPQVFEFNGFGCSGANQSPILEWKNAPQGTKSFAITVHDADAPTGGAGFWHWVVANIPAEVNKLEHDAGNLDNSKLPQGALQLKNDYGSFSFGGACPPPGETHRYKFVVYALNCVLDINQDLTTSLVGFLINSNKLDQAEFTVNYQR